MRPELQGQALRELSILHQLTTTRLNRALRPLGITMTHTSLLFHLMSTPEGTSIGEIADAMEVNQPAVSKTVKALVDQGAVTVESAPDDARRRVVKLTQTGGELLTRAMMAMHPDATLAFEPLDDDRLRGLIGLIAELNAHLDAARDAR
ncbi:DNA-binding MarR family transcriptional regulator [Allocatelliglobosispora scoriae]|uniref:DNA-binding MarR family transcriptional regulator n=1 Tax=Allocatelliglobosispora scoriae TaxID=643052 RepID=A0A841BMR7_9ACTN|nr:MarR family transcriptional regulator [Allocatelliglobosispora scoriae]MBB5868141.1 DNA-binding MarR family transcriptional regulator [Allocatelliglobosispora scoriae]